MYTYINIYLCKSCVFSTHKCINSESNPPNNRLNTLQTVLNIAIARNLGRYLRQEYERGQTDRDGSTVLRVTVFRHQCVYWVDRGQPSAIILSGTIIT